MNISCLEELQMKLDLCISRDERLSILKDAGKKIKTDKWFVVTDNGQCYLFDRDGVLDDISKITELRESYVKKDIKRICIPDSVTSIGNFAFYNCTRLTNVTISNRVTSIENYAFAWCSSLTSVIIPDSVTSIGNCVFAWCNGLTSVTISNSVTSIGYHAFSNCSGLISVTIPDNVTSIGRGVFHNCTHLMSVTFKDKTFDQVKTMDNYPWGIKDTSIIHVE